jgi:hypothetical protein
VSLRLDRAGSARILGIQLVGGGVEVDAQERFQPPQLGRLFFSDRDEVLVLSSLLLLLLLWVCVSVEREDIIDSSG